MQTVFRVMFVDFTGWHELCIVVMWNHACFSYPTSVSIVYYEGMVNTFHCCRLVVVWIGGGYCSSVLMHVCCCGHISCSSCSSGQYVFVFFLLQWTGFLCLIHIHSQIQLSRTLKIRRYLGNLLLILDLKFHGKEYARLFVYGLRSRHTCGALKNLKATGEYPYP